MLIHEIYHKSPVTILEDVSVRDALNTILHKGINGLVVVNKASKVVGVLAVQDIAGATIPRQFKKNIHMAAAMYRKGFFSESCLAIQDDPVSKYMRKNFVSVNLQDNIMAVTADFLKNDLYIVPVIEDGKLLGVITRSEIKKALAYGMKLQELCPT
ncbi:MAG: CBS domain-containing protein [Candidatus Pacebacteria bacterium]|nr:CBS domain-containing protein [Candidatus Paceibacterota bacterium]